MTTHKPLTQDDILVDEVPIAETVELEIFNKAVRIYVKAARRSGEPLVTIIKQLMFAAHVANKDGQRASSTEPLYWTRHLEMVKFVIGYTQAALENGRDLDLILSQLRLAAFQGERDWLKETRDSDPHATKDLPPLEEVLKSAESKPDDAHTSSGAAMWKGDA